MPKGIRPTQDAVRSSLILGQDLTGLSFLDLLPAALGA